MTKSRNSFAEYKSIKDKTIAYLRDKDAGAVAHTEKNTVVPLASVPVQDVEFIAGLWRVQHSFDYEIQMIRDKQMVLGKKLPHTERIPFEYFEAFSVDENCYGKWITSKPEYIVAKYTTDDGIFWGYGKNIEGARAFLGIKLFDTYMDLIHVNACKKMLGNRQK
jgi:hypothetical protein